jgi:beta-lactamase class D
LLPFFGSMLVPDVEAADVARYQEKRAKERAANATTVRMAKRYGHISEGVLSAAVGTLDAPKSAGN